MTTYDNGYQMDEEHSLSFVDNNFPDGWVFEAEAWVPGAHGNIVPVVSIDTLRRIMRQYQYGNYDIANHDKTGVLYVGRFSYAPVKIAPMRPLIYSTDALADLDITFTEVDA